MSRLDPSYLDLLAALAQAFASDKNLDGFLTGYCDQDWRKAKHQATPEHARPDLTCEKCFVISHFLVDGICPDCKGEHAPRGYCDICGDIAYLYQVEVKTYDQSMPLRQTGTQINKLCGDCIYDIKPQGD